MKTITFFMLVTNRDAYLASYSIKSYQKLIPVLNNYRWKLIVYLNCLKDVFKNEYIKEWEKFDYVEIEDNSNIVNVEELIPGNFVKSEEGWEKLIEGQYEPCGVVWTRECRRFETDYWVTVDADFEILSPNFIVDAFDKLENNDNLVVISSDCNDNQHGYDSFSNENIVSMKRYNTWFCIYKKAVQRCSTSHFYYHEIIHGLRLSFDESAKFQWDLREKFGFEMDAVDKKYKSSFIHYGAFSKNNSLDTPRKIYFYRKISILAHRGLLCGGGKSVINKIIRKVFKIIHKLFYNRLMVERGENNYHSKLDE